MRDQNTEQLTHSILNAISAHVCIINAQGMVLSANASLRNVAPQNVLLSSVWNPGDDYLKVCEQIKGDYADEAMRIAKAIRSVIGGKHHHTSFVYSCQSPPQKTWFRVKIIPVEGEGLAHIVVIHENITELQFAQDALRMSKEQYRTLVEHSPYCIYQLNRKGQVISMNHAGIQMIRCKKKEEIIGKPYLDFVANKDRPRIAELFELALKKVESEYEFEGPDKRFFHASFLPIEHDHGKVHTILGLTQEVREHKPTETMLHRFAQGTASSTGQAFFDEFIKHLALATGVRFALITEVMDEQGSCLRPLACWHQELNHMLFDYDVAGTPWESPLLNSPVYYPNRVQEFFPHDKGLAEIQADSYLGLALVGKSGDYIGHICVAHDGPLENFNYVKMVLSIFADRAAVELERMRAEQNAYQALEQAQQLARQLVSAQEEERKRIARELHDEFGQILTGLKFSISHLATQFDQLNQDPSNNPYYAQLHSITKAVDTAIYTMRRIATDLRPSMLDDLGLLAALEWQIQEFQTRTSLPCRLIISKEINTIDFAPHCSLTLFRITQELLTNVLKHADATKVTVSLSHRDEYLILEMKDDGRGITRQEIEQTTSLGLNGIRERLSEINGTMIIQGEEGKGTRVAIQVPTPLISAKD
ncbi:PAS domain-containing sensor histidine kinase [Nitrospira sp. M1]